MAKTSNDFWHRTKYKINGLLIFLPFYFLYLALNPVFPDALETKIIGNFEVSPMPYDLKQPYMHDDDYIKDFFLTFNKGNINNIRQAYLNIGTKPLPISELELNSEGILHGSQHGQEVHAISPKTLKPEHKIWLTIQNWQGEVFTVSWNIPKAFL